MLKLYKFIKLMYLIVALVHGYHFPDSVRCNNDGLTKDKCDDCGNDKSKCSSEDCYLKKVFLFKSCVETVGCKCKDLISEFGWGNCKKVDTEIGKVTCYVKSPSNCTDLKNSNAERGVSKDEQYSAEACRQDGSWGSWDQWSTCSVTCDGGFQSRHRECDDPEPINGGSHCSVDGSIGSHSQRCNEHPCPSINTECLLNEYMCDDGKCISLDWRCDGESDCDDSEDETNCEGQATTKIAVTKDPTKLLSTTPKTTKWDSTKASSTDPPVNFGMWVSGVIGGISGALVLGCCLIFYRMKNKYNDKGTHNAADSSQIGFLDISPEMRNRIYNLCHSSKMEIARNKFEIGVKIGSGNFGNVYKGHFKGWRPSDIGSTVAIKSSKNEDEEEMNTILSEIEIMMSVPYHLNLVGMVASSTSEFETSRKIWLLMEFCLHGNLKDYLIRNKDQIMSENDGKAISSRCLVKWAHNIAKGMQFLSEREIMHGDLAARNILLGENPLKGQYPVALIADFGLSKDFGDYATYVKKSRRAIPWKWMALEYLKYHTFTRTSDVWSFGILFWEILAFGKEPYGHVRQGDLIGKLENGYRLPFPSESNEVKTWSPEKLFLDLSDICFIANPEQRGDFLDVLDIIENELLPEELSIYEKMSQTYESTVNSCYIY